MYQKDDLKIYLIKRKDKDGESRTKFANFKDTISRFNQCRRDNLFSEKDIEDLLTTKDNGVANVGRFNKVVLTNQQASQNWESIYKTIQEFDFKKDSHEILSKKYIKLLNTVKKTAITNRLLATFFYKYLTATCNEKHFQKIAEFMYENFENYPEPHKNWLLDNLDFVTYCRESLGEDYDPLLISYSWDLYKDIKNKKIYELLEDRTMTNTEEPTLAQECAELLKNTKNVILHGAPGTGKTYLAKQIAQQMIFGEVKIEQDFTKEEKKKFNEQVELVQFHPSYDYTDFVEGIRPTTDGKFNLEDGIFKKFCEKAILDNISDSEATDTQKTQNNKNSNQTRDYYRGYSDLLEYLLWLKDQLTDGKILANDELEKFENELNRFKNRVMKYCPELSDSSQASALVIELNNFLQNFDLNENFPEIRMQIIQDMSLKLYNFLKTNNPKNDLYTFWPLLISDLYDSPKSPDYEFKLNRVILKTRWRYFSITEIKNGIKIKFTDLEKFYQGKRKSKTDKICSDIINYLKEKHGLKDYNENETPIESAAKIPEYAKKKNPFIFIIDEINRGELSKIFGELFFSIDPGYRGIKGAILTQYANMVTKPNKFDTELGITDPNTNSDTVETENDKNKGNYGHFFVPENVYIIGTMNDIDRSVESMDLAMRRRFTFFEIKAKDTQKNILAVQLVDESIRTNAQEHMDNLNNAIWNDDNKTGELSSSDYHIGGAYFLKLNNFEGTSEEKFQKLWKYNLEPLLNEYLRGQYDAEKKLKTLGTAYRSEQKADEQANKE